MVIEKREKCAVCGNLHAAPADCAYPELRALFGDVTSEGDSFLRWLASWDQQTREGFIGLIGQARNEAVESQR